MPTTSPASIASRSSGSRVSSTICGSPQRSPVAEASTYSHRGVMTATPKDCVLGLTRWTRGTGRLDLFSRVRDGTRQARGTHDLPFGNLVLRRDRELPRSVDARRAPAIQLGGTKSRQHREPECTDSVRTLDHTNLPSWNSANE